MYVLIYLFNNAHTGTTTSDLKNSENIIDQLKCCINVTKRPGAVYFNGNLAQLPQSKHCKFGQ